MFTTHQSGRPLLHSAQYSFLGEPSLLYPEWVELSIPSPNTSLGSRPRLVQSRYRNRLAVAFGHREVCDPSKVPRAANSSLHWPGARRQTACTGRSEVLFKESTKLGWGAEQEETVAHDISSNPGLPGSVRQHPYFVSFGKAILPHVSISEIACVL